MYSSSNKENDDTFTYNPSTNKRRNSIMKSPAYNNQANMSPVKNRRKTMSTSAVNDRRVSFGVVNVRVFHKDSDINGKMNSPYKSPSKEIEKKNISPAVLKENVNTVKLSTIRSSPRSKKPSMSELPMTSPSTRRSSRRRSSASPSSFPALLESDKNELNNEIINVNFNSQQFVFKPLDILPESPMPNINMSNLYPIEDDDNTSSSNAYSNLFKKLEAESSALTTNTLGSLLDDDATVNLQSTTPSTLNALLNDDQTVALPSFTSYASDTLNNLINNDQTVCMKGTSINTLVDEDQTVCFQSTSSNAFTSLVDEDQTVVLPTPQALLSNFQLQNIIDEDTTNVYPRYSTIESLVNEDNTSKFSADVEDFTMEVENDTTNNIPIIPFDNQIGDFGSAIKPVAIRAVLPVRTPIVNRRVSDVAMEIDTPTKEIVLPVAEAFETVDNTNNALLSNLLEDDQTVMIPKSFLFSKTPVVNTPFQNNNSILMHSITSEFTDQDVSLDTSVVSNRSVDSQGSPNFPVPPPLNHGPSVLVSHSTWQVEQNRLAAAIQVQASPSKLMSSFPKSPANVNSNTPSIVKRTPPVGESPFLNMLNNFNTLQKQQNELSTSSLANRVFNEPSVSIMKPIQLIMEDATQSISTMVNSHTPPSFEAIQWNHPSLGADTNKTIDGSVTAKFIQEEFNKVLYGGKSSDITQTVNLGQISDDTMALVMSQAQILMEQEGNMDFDLKSYMDNLRNKYQRPETEKTVEYHAPRESTGVVSEDLIEFFNNFDVQFTDPSAFSSSRQSSVNGFVQRDNYNSGKLTLEEEMELVLIAQPELDNYENACHELQQKIDVLKTSVAESYNLLSQSPSQLITTWAGMDKNTSQYSNFEELVKQYLTKCKMEANNDWNTFRAEFEANLVNTLTEQRDQCQSDLYKMSSVLDRLKDADLNSFLPAVDPSLLDTYNTQLKIVTIEIRNWNEKIAKCSQDKLQSAEISKNISNTKNALEIFKMISDWELTLNLPNQQEFTFKKVIFLKVMNRKNLELKVFPKMLSTLYNRRIPLNFAEKLLSTIDLNLVDDYSETTFASQVIQKLDASIGRILDLFEEIHALEFKHNITVECKAAPQPSVVIILTRSLNGVNTVLRSALDINLNPREKLPLTNFNVIPYCDKVNLRKDAVVSLVEQTVGYNRLTRISQYFKQNM